jgi:hypothetical protein
MKAKLIKIDNQNLVKMEQDPISNFIEMLRKITAISNSKDTATTLKRDLKKYYIELFNKRVVLNHKISSVVLKQELNKVALCDMYLITLDPNVFKRGDEHL